MENRFKKRKKPNYKRAVILVLVLALIIFLWFNVESLVEGLFETN